MYTQNPRVEHQNLGHALRANPLHKTFSGSFFPKRQRKQSNAFVNGFVAGPLVAVSLTLAAPAEQYCVGKSCSRLGQVVTDMVN